MIVLVTIYCSRCEVGGQSGPSHCAFFESSELKVGRFPSALQSTHRKYCCEGFASAGRYFSIGGLLGTNPKFGRENCHKINPHTPEILRLP